VLLLDEPTVGLDAAARQSITDHVHDLAATGLSVLWTTHLTDEVRDTDALLVLHQGQIINAGQAGSLRDDTPLPDWFLARTGASV
jgi:ABC-2 type transport system ATP-binding protein